MSGSSSLNFSQMEGYTASFSYAIAQNDDRIVSFNPCRSGVQVHPITGSIAGQTVADIFFSWESIRWINRKENVQG